MRARLAILILALAGIGVLLWRWSARGTPAPDASGEVALEADPGPLAEQQATERNAPEEGAIERESLPPGQRELVPDSKASLRGKVITLDGAPVPGALVSWLAQQEEDTEGTPAWPGASWGAAARHTVVRRTEADGSFEFARDAAGPLPYGSVLLAQHPEYFQGGHDLGVEPEAWPAEVRIRLEPAEPIDVRVVDGDEQGQADVTVFHAGVPRRPSAGEPPLASHERFLFQQALTDASGHARLAPFRGEQAFWAERGEEASVPWQGPRPKHVTLRLGASFTIGGTLALPDWASFDEEWEGERRILVSAQEGNLWRPVARLRDVAAGSWGPLRVPLGVAKAYTVRLEGIPITPIEETFAAPAPGSHRRIDFAAELEAYCYLLVMDEAEQPIPTARAVAWWGDPSLSLPPTVPQHVEGAARADGFLFLGGLPMGKVRYQVSAPGYSFVEGIIEPGSHFPVVLVRGGRVEGRCRRAGKPVRDFEIVYWRNGPSHQRRSRSFFDREDGAFTLDDLTPGEWSVSATSPGSPLGRPATVRIEAEGVAELELELGVPLAGGGRVLAGNSDEPVAGARVQPYSSGGVERCFPWGPPAITAEDGGFVLEAFVPGTNYLSVEAAGYGSTETKAFAEGQDFLDFGDIRLFEPRSFELRLLGLEELHGLSPLDLRATTMKSAVLPPTHFRADGTLRYEAVPPGILWLFITTPDENWARLHLHLEPGKDWRFDYKIAGEKRLRVIALDEHGKPVPPATTIGVLAQEVNGVFVMRSKYTPGEKGIVEFEGLRANEAQVWIAAERSAPAASRDVTLVEGVVTEVTLRLGEAPLRLRVVDPEGQPMAGVWASVRSLEGNQIIGRDDTDSEGWASIRGLPRGMARLDLAHGIAGRRDDLLFDAGQDEQVFVLDARSSLELRLLDGSVPLAGVAVRLETSGAYALSDPRSTDEHGVTRFGPLGEGAYGFGCRRADCWPLYRKLEVGPKDQGVHELQMRRLAGLELVLRDANGTPIAAAEVELRSLEFGVEVAEWVRADRVTAPQGLRTNALGVLRLEGLPRGQYIWSIPGDDASGGTLELVAGSANRLDVRLAPR